MNKIEKLKKDDFKALNQLLVSSGLPVVDTNDQTEHFFKVNNHSNNIAGAIGLEIYGPCGLLRSLVVHEAYRNKSIAKVLVQSLITHAHELGLKKLVLLTTTADKYFEKHQFQRIQRNEVPDEIKQSKEFAGICPVSAIVMQKIL